jgi:twinkle protein
MVRLAGFHGWPFAVCSPENQPLQRHLAGIIAVRFGKPFDDGPTPRLTREEVDEAWRWAEPRFAFVLPEEPTIDAVLERAKVLVYRMGIRGLVVDPWNELDHSRPDRMTETEYVSQVLTKLRAFARLHGVHVWLVAHPTKLQRDKDGAYPVPTPYDISGSANFFAKADYCLSVWRDKTDATVPVSVHVQKVRFAETGELGVVDFRYDRPTGRFFEV